MSPKELRYGCQVADNIYFAKQLDNLGVNRKYTAFYLLVEIMQILINEERRVVSFSKQVYPQIAQKYGKTDCTIERNIRNLISQCWCEDMMKKLNTYYPESQKPTCREFVYLIKKYIENQIL